MASPAEEYLKEGQISKSLEELETQIRSNPSDAKLRVFLFQLLCVLGDWKRAITQLNVAAELDTNNLLMAHLCRAALNSEALRAEIFAGKRSPLFLGEPEEWVGWLVQANQMVAEEKYGAAQKLRQRAFSQAEAVGGTINGEQFEWICDADSRLGPALEAVIDGKYYWLPFKSIKQMRIEPPVDLRDMVWISANFIWTNGGEAIGLIPTRYPGSETSEDSAIMLARKTEWVKKPAETYLGLGQRILATDKNEYSLLEIRQMELN